MDTPEPTWAFLADQASALVRPDAWHQTVQWASNRVHDELGPTWPETAFAKHGEVPGGLELVVGGHPHAVADWVELALFFAELAAVPRLRQVRRELAGDSREEKLISTRLQLEVAALALAQGLVPVTFEPAVGDGPRQADVALAVGGQPVIVETVAVLADQRSREAYVFWDAISARIHMATGAFEVRVSGQVGKELSRLDQDELIAQLTDASRDVLADRRARTVELPQFATTLHLTTDASTLATLQGPMMEMDLTRRMMGRIAEKAEQTTGAERAWIRVDARDAVRNSTPWGNGLLQEHVQALELMARSVLEDSPHVAGVVISTGTLFEIHDRDDELTQSTWGSYGVRCRLHPWRRRETLVIPVFEDQSTRAEARAWAELYAAEPGWLEAALARQGLPPLAMSFPGAVPEA
jgi:hypothetical protein